MSRGASPAERAEFSAAWHVANAKLHPSPDAIHRATLQFVSEVVNQLTAAGTIFTTEGAQYIAVYAAKKALLCRAIEPLEAEQLQRASKAFWNATATSKYPKVSA